MSSSLLSTQVDASAVHHALYDGVSLYSSELQRALKVIELGDLHLPSLTLIGETLLASVSRAIMVQLMFSSKLPSVGSPSLIPGALLASTTCFALDGKTTIPCPSSLLSAMIVHDVASETSVAFCTAAKRKIMVKLSRYIASSLLLQQLCSSALFLVYFQNAVLLSFAEISSSVSSKKTLIQKVLNDEAQHAASFNAQKWSFRANLQPISLSGNVHLVKKGIVHASEVLIGIKAPSQRIIDAATQPWLTFHLGVAHPFGTNLLAGQGNESFFIKIDLLLFNPIESLFKVFLSQVISSSCYAALAADET